MKLPLREESLSTVQTELKQEQASAMGRTVQAFERAMERYHADATDDARAEAKQRLWYLVVQREAIGLNRHRELYELYRVPKAWWY